MERNAVSAALLERLGVEGTDGLLQLLERARADWTADVVALAVERFERRLVQELSAVRVENAQSHAALREDLAREFAAVRTEMADHRFELLKWSFLFWVGQVIAIVGLVGAMLAAFLPR